jgi:predicted extracellular nuclease
MNTRIYRMVMAAACVLGAVGTAEPVMSQEAATPFVPIYEIQGATHVSPYLGERVRTEGVVTAIAFNGYYLQDPDGDGDPATSDGIFVFDRRTPPEIGDFLEVEDVVSEFIPGGASTGNLSITQLSFPTILASTPATRLPDPVLIGRRGRRPPARVVISEREVDPPINLQDAADADANRFNPRRDGIDFYESLEGMLVEVDQPVAVSAIRQFNAFSSEFFTLPSNGRGIAPSSARTARGGIALQPDPDNRGDQNPERVQIQIDGTLYPSTAAFPSDVTVGDRFENIVGVVGYSFGNFEVNAIEEVQLRRDGGTEEEFTHLFGTRRRMTLAAYNVLNLSAGPEDDLQRATVARHIAENLACPDVVALQEIQDNNGESGTGDGVVDADLTLSALVQAIYDASGPECPRYEAFDVAPEENTSGGIPGGNIRNAFLYQPSRVTLDAFESLTPDVLASLGVSNPDAFLGTRNPLVATFTFRGEQVTIINNHLTSRFGSTPVFGGVQPFVQAGELEREAQVGALNEVVDGILRTDPHANVVVTGDLNTLEFTNDLEDILPGRPRILFNLIDRLRDDNVYTFIFDGNSQVLDHALVSRNLRFRSEIDIVHVNVDFPRLIGGATGSDHEPLLVRLDLGHGRSFLDLLRWWFGGPYDGDDH